MEGGKKKVVKGVSVAIVAIVAIVGIVFGVRSHNAEEE